MIRMRIYGTGERFKCEILGDLIRSWTSCCLTDEHVEILHRRLPVIAIKEDPVLMADVKTAHSIMQERLGEDRSTHFSGKLYRSAIICHYHVDLNNASTKVLMGQHVVPFVGNAGSKQKSNILIELLY